MEEAGRDGAMNDDRTQQCPWCGHWMEEAYAYRDMQGHPYVVMRCTHCGAELTRAEPWPEELDA